MCKNHIILLMFFMFYMVQSLELEATLKQVTKRKYMIRFKVVNLEDHFYNNSQLMILWIK